MLQKIACMFASLLAVFVTSTAYGAKYQLLPDLSGSSYQNVTSNVVGGVLTRITVRTSQVVVDVDTDDIFDCEAMVYYSSLNGTYRNDVIDRAICKIVASGPSHDITSFNLKLPFFDPAAGHDPKTLLRPAFFWQVSNNTDISVCLQITQIAGPILIRNRLFGMMYCKIATVDTTKGVPDETDPLVDLGDHPLNP
ncbi:hypothetical protein NKJ84_16140 [Mesorhizobium sp. M0048]|uniref:hypothetical protein n=1 Tax=Mesorhizobium sp. M0048 TaxID=2956860 RepID=UPI00333B3318